MRATPTLVSSLTEAHSPIAEPATAQTAGWWSMLGGSFAPAATPVNSRASASPSEATALMGPPAAGGSRPDTGRSYSRRSLPGERVLVAVALLREQHHLHLPGARPVAPDLVGR